MASKMLIGVASVLYFLGAVQAYSGGAPPEVCDDMMPKHPYSPQKSTIPYSVQLNSEAVASGGVVEITIAGKEDFKGFLLQVRHGDKPVGKFLVPDDEKYTKTINCGEGQQVMFEMFRHFITRLFPQLKRILPENMLQNAATHKNSEPKNKLVIKWQAPAGLKDQVQVYVTVAKDGGTYWVRKPQATIKVN